MKLANALSQRSELQERIRQLETRLLDNARVQEGEQPAEDPEELLAELESCCGQLEDLIGRINRTNSATQVKGRALSDLLACRDVWKQKLQILREFLSSASDLATRRTVGEIKIRSTVNVREMQKQLDAASKALRELDETIQEANWTTELLEK